MPFMFMNTKHDIMYMTPETYIISQKLDPVITKLTIPLNPPLSTFPSDVLKYMNANANPKQAVKLMKRSKYFLQEKCQYTFLGRYLTLHSDCLENYYREYKLNELPNNLGFCHKLCVEDGSLLPQLMSKTVACELEYLILKALRIPFDGFKFLISSGKVKRLELYNSCVINENDEIVTYEDLIDLIPSLRNLELKYNPTRKFSPKFLEKICDSNLEDFNIIELTEDFDFEEFVNSLKKKPKFNIHLYFLESVNCEMVHPYIDIFLAAGLTDIYPPYTHGCFPRYGHSPDLNFRCHDSSVGRALE
uniref:Uncharacterized protein n=1 Tax=Panagrolaimus davidi TaxID=227884 RepID=A0A914QE83_9BILA